MKKSPRRHREVPSRPVQRQPRWGVLLSCLTLSGLLLGLLICGTIGVGTSLVWLTALSAETGRTVPIPTLRPLSLPTLTPTVLPTVVIGPTESEAEPVVLASPPPIATSSPTPVASITPSLTLDDNPTVATPVASTPLSTTVPNSTPIPTSDSDEVFGPKATTIPEWWQNYIERVQNSGY